MSVKMTVEWLREQLAAITAELKGPLLNHLDRRLLYEERRDLREELREHQDPTP